MKNNKKIALFLSVASVGTLVGIVCGSVVNVNNYFSQDVPCTDHVGNHYTEVAPTKTKSGHKEFWVCCKCHEVWLEEPQEGVFSDVQESVMTGGLTDGHDAYLPDLTTQYEVSDADELEDALRFGYQSILVGKDINVSETLIVNSVTTIDLNGHTISKLSTKKEDDSLLTNNGILTITSSKEDGMMTYACSDPSMLGTYVSNTITNYGKLTIDSNNVTIENSSIGLTCYAIETNSTVREATLSVNGGNLTSTGGSSIMMIANSSVFENNVSINDGYINGYYYGLRINNLKDDVKLNVSIDGGEFESTNTETNYNVSMVSPELSFDGSISISDGKFNDKAASLPAGVISGGTWGASPAEFVASNCEVVDNKDGTFTVIEKDCGHNAYVYELLNDLTIKKICTVCLKETTVKTAKELENKVLVKNVVTGYYEVSSKTLKEIINNADSNTTVDVLLGAGKYAFTNGSSQGKAHSNVIIKIHGFTIGSKKQSHLDDVAFTANGASYTSFPGVTLEMDHLIMEGRKDYNIGWYSGIQSDKFICHNCDFLGGTTTYASQNEFHHCTFDTTMIATKADYAIYMYNSRTIVNYCTFETSGKAIKIYSEGDIGGTFDVLNSTFTIGDTLATAKADKAAVEIDSTYQSTKYYVVNCLNCKQTDYDAGLVRDTSTHSIINTEDCKNKSYVYSLSSDLTVTKICTVCLKEETVEDATELENKVLVKNVATGYYEVSSKTLKEIINSADSSNTVDVLLGAGSYAFNKGSSQEKNHTNIVVKIHGLVIDGKKQSHLDDVAFTANGASYITFPGVTLEMDHLIMEGRKDYALGWYSGIQSDKFICYDCDFLGGTTTYANQNEFYNCTFDTTMIATKADYAIYMYNSRTIVDNCTFVTSGKAIKIYSEGDIGGTFDVSNCNFKIGTKLATAKADKAAVEIDSTYQSTKYYVVNCLNCKQVGFDGGLVKDVSTHSTIVIK